jgi:glycosyltransferase involved in cell wall biosynthesis
MENASLRSVLDTFRFYISSLLKIKGYGISIIVPFHLDRKNSRRGKNWRWLQSYWKANLPGAEIIVGNDEGALKDNLPFSKSVAVNDAISRAHGDIFVIADADVYISMESVLYCAKEIRDSRNKGYKLWFMPYRKMFRLNREASNKLLASSPKNPLTFPSPPSPNDYSNKTEFEGTPVSQIAHWYGAMIQIMHREAFEIVGGWDRRFCGWGGEDSAAMMAMDTLYSQHKNLDSSVLHVWHPERLVEGSSDTKGKRRLWANQEAAGSNDALSWRYYGSIGNRTRMRKLVDEFKDQNHTPQTLKRPPFPPNLSS